MRQMIGERPMTSTERSRRSRERQRRRLQQGDDLIRALISIDLRSLEDGDARAHLETLIVQAWRVAGD